MKKKPALLPRTMAFIMALLAFITSVEAREPLLMEGKETLHQRILTRPGAPLTEAPEASATIEELPAFEMFYVYDRREAGGEEFVEVGRTLEGGPEGWLPKERTIDWKHTIVLGFNNPANRERALIFRSRDDLEATLNQEDVAARLGRLREEAEAEELAEESPVVSIEPAEHVDIEEEFYVLPILDAYDIRLPTNMRTKLLRIASVPQTSEPPALDPEAGLENFRVGLTFVIDTTRSMQPYIDAVRRSMTRLRDRIAGSPEADRFRFGLVAFRDNTDLVPGLEYVTRTFLELSEDADADAFVEAIADVEAAEANSSGFNEDVIAGLMTAAREMDWAPFGGGYIVLISDAGPRPPGEEAALGALAPAQAREELNAANIAPFVLHLKSEEGSFDHAYAEEAYRELARFNDDALYFAIDGGDPEAFAAQIDRVADKLEAMVSAAMEGRMEEAVAGRAAGIDDAVARVGRAMQLAYLGRIAGTRAPDVFEGWLTQNDPLDRRARPVRPYVLMSRNELASLRDVLRETIDLAGDVIAEGSSSDFFDKLREAVALMSRNPEAVADAGTLGGVLGEYLEDLPYNSQITNLTEEDWRLLSPIQERQLIDTLRSKVEALARIHDQSDRWHAVAPAAPDGEYVTIVPLSLMP